SKHSDLSPSRIRKDIRDVTNIIALMNDTFLHPFSSSSELLSISSGVIVPHDVVDDILDAKKIGVRSMNSFIKDRLDTDAVLDLFDSIRKTNLFTFSKLTKSTKCKVNGREVILTADKNLFGKISIIMQKRQFDLESVFQYPLGPLPWSLGGSMGELKKKQIIPSSSN
ncbi:MAG: hypothetical protein MK200_08075, partial [Nitrosopumilus sp.]|nr:hypothetical protein [Nitrosopumilus sp.]